MENLVRKHGHATPPTRTYQSWVDMRKRCFRKNHKDYPRYGGRGITVCERWLSFEGFLADMGEAPAGLTLERKDSDGNYEPGNCKWATWAEQRLNRRLTHKHIEYAGERLTVGEWDAKLGLQQGGIWHRLKNGWTLEKALTTRRSNQQAGRTVQRLRG